MGDIQLNPAAEREIRRLWHDRPDGDTPLAVRLAVRDGGCNGYIYALYPLDAVVGSDLSFETQSVIIAIDPESYARMADASLVIDYSEDLIGGAFRFETDGGTDREVCDCGFSFRLVA